MPTLAHLALLSVSAGLLVASLLAAILRDQSTSPLMPRAVWGCRIGAILTGVALLVWFGLDRGSLMPLRDNFDALVWLSLLATVFLSYVQVRRPVRGLEYFITPLAVLLLAAAGLFGTIWHHDYRAQSLWHYVHRFTAYSGVLSFLISAAAGVSYLLAQRRLRTHRGGTSLGSLERLSQFMHLASTVGFGLLTIGLVTGLSRIFAGQSRLSPHDPKIILAGLAWLVFAVVAHAPLSSRLTGRRVAWLSIGGFMLIVGVVIALQFV
jgi:ABC-type uncharacterized transport system permease subunit